MPKKVKLKPCPFCGGRGIKASTYKSGEGYVLHVCPVIGWFQIWKASNELAVIAWNHRARRTR